jgi:hypothetical protein
MKYAKVLCVAVVLLVASGAAAVDEHDEAAREMLKAMRVQEMAKSGAGAMVDVMVQSNPGLAPFRDIITKWSDKVMTWDAMAPGMIEAYKTTFTTAEMKTITAFYKTPEGTKLLEKMPELMQKQAQIGTALAQAHQGELKAAIEARAKELQAKEGKKSE